MIEIIKAGDILLPKVEIEYSKWAVVACDQFTSQPEYWKQVEDITRDSYSTYDIVFPEVYLNDNPSDRIAKINANMDRYLQANILDTYKESFVLIDRQLADGRHRLGLMITVDLEAYEYKPFSNAPIKATEGTILDRIPPRVAIRENAQLELPHIMLIMDDREKNIIEGLYARTDNLKQLYCCELMLGGGNISGYLIEDTESIINDIYKLIDKQVVMDKYGVDTNFLFAVGDGNHSLATAKTHWENVKSNLKDSEIEGHSARYALCELVNLHDSALVFEPIHRVVLGAKEGFVTAISEAINGDSQVELLVDGSSILINAPTSAPEAIKVIQKFLDEYAIDNDDVEIDYIHGKDNLNSVCNSLQGLGIVMPKIDKSELFGYILKNGVLPRKAFSMGEAEEKRYYLETKKIR